jgi:hypothetical protein
MKKSVSAEPRSADPGGGAGGLSRNQNLRDVPLPNRHPINDALMWRDLGPIAAKQWRCIKSLS